ncbi:intermembrane lipid transfer protein VPS13A-like [Lycorma delicatula]|uniref:intermembrane lipid transfer protein VPS13A-like n=1 Tax=Lycorma delicatula TaxID=130591 RepID=UPI003F50F586
MFEGVVATILNKYLGKYIQDLDTENLNVGIFGGDVQLTELKLKPDALYELDLPIEVKVGTIGRISLHIPWSGLYTQSVLLEIEDVYLIAGPITDRSYDPDKEKVLCRASKRKKLQDLQDENLLGTGAPENHSFIENLITTIMNNLQVFVHNIHVRYEDSTLKGSDEHAFACGLCVQSFSIETTNSKWKPVTSVLGSTSVYQLLRVESLSVYCNPCCTELIGSSPGLATAAPYTWRNDMKRGLETFSINGEEFDFILKPITAKVKVIVNKSNEARVPKLLVDFVLQDAATQLTRPQYLAIIELVDSLKRISINRKFRQYHPGVVVSNNAAKWWKYAYTASVEQRLKPYTWRKIQAHRENYKRYRDVYKQTLLHPTDTELKLDLQQLEDQLDVIDIIIAQEHAKIMLHRESPERVTVLEHGDSWWKGWLDGETRLEMKVIADKERGLWAQLSPSEKAKLYNAIGYVEGGPACAEKPKQYIEHKVNMTLANCCLSLINRGREILVVTLAQFLASIETRPSAKAFKISARVESLVVEGASVEHDLVPIITADNILTGNTSSNFLSIDFERNPLNSEADYGLALGLESVEVVYHEHAVSELMSFLQAPTMSLISLTKDSTSAISNSTVTIIQRAISRHEAIQLNLDLKLPYIVIPELGSLQKGGNLAIIDLGRIKVTSELQPSNICLEDATQMELEERLYDRFHVDLYDLQFIFCDSGDEWRDAKKMLDSDFHVIPKIQCQLVFSNSVRPEYKQLPRHKLNITMNSLKFNLSDRRIGSLLLFLENVPSPSANTVHVSQSSTLMATDIQLDVLDDMITLEHFRIKKLMNIKSTIASAEIQKQNKTKETGINKVAAKMAMLEVDKSFISSEHSDEEMELWARTVDLPGFDDNVSPNNAITMLLRFVIGEIVIQLCRSNNRVDKPYLMLVLRKLCCDTALMEYGPAMQASLGDIQLVDKLHVGASGEYLDLVSSELPGEDLITILYRKVRSDCPDFKSHFHSVERSLVIDFSMVSVVLHREAIVTMNKYLQYIIQKIKSRETEVLFSVISSKKQEFVQQLLPLLFGAENDPPIPPGATKFSYSTRLSEFKLRLCDTDMEFLLLKVTGLESDCLFKANERMILRVYLSGLSIDDLSDMTLYPKVLSVEEDKVIDFKYMRHSPRLYRQTDIDAKKDDVKSDGSLKLHVGRVHVIVLYKMFIDLQHFMEPFIRPNVIIGLAHTAKRNFMEQLTNLKTCNTRLHLSLDLHAPSLLLPQKLASPNLIILSLGDLSVENFFKEVSSTLPSDSGPVPVIDNILVRFEQMQLCRALMTLAGSLEVQEPIIEPINVSLDIKRTVGYHGAVSAHYISTCSQLLLYQVVGVVDNIRINLGQRDLTTLLSVWADNFNDALFFDDMTGCWRTTSPPPPDPPTPSVPVEDPSVRRLQAFFSHNEQVRREATLNLTLDGLQLYLFNDIDEVLSSPLRDMNHGLCKLETGEATVNLEMFTDSSLEMKIALQTCRLHDIRPDNNSPIKKIFQSHGGDLRMDNDSHISVSMPPIVDIMFRQTQTGDCCIDVLVERTRLNLSVPFVLELGRFIMDSLPGERPYDGGVINHGYIGDSGIQQQQHQQQQQNKCLNNATSETVAVRPPSSADSTSGYFSSGASCFDDQTGVSISLQFRRPEIMLFTQREDNQNANFGEIKGSHALLLRTEFLLEYSKHPGRDSLVCSLSGLHLLSNFSKTPYMVLYPCDIEFSKNYKCEDGLKMVVSLSSIDIHFSPSTVHTLSSLIDEINLHVQPEDLDIDANILHLASELEDLWSPKKIGPYTFSNHNDDAGFRRACRPQFSEICTISAPKICVVFELESAGHKIPVVLLKTIIEASVHDWSTALHMKGELKLQASCYNGSVGAWEPLIEPVIEEPNVARPWEMLFKVFQAKAYMISSRTEHGIDGNNGNNRVKDQRSTSLKDIAGDDESETSADEMEPETMTFIRRRDPETFHNQKKNAIDSISLVGYPEDSSDSENEEGVMEKLANAIGHLFTGDSSEGEDSESDESSGAEPSGDTEDASEIESVSVSAGTIIGRDERAVFLKKHCDSVDSGLETESVDRLSTYVLIESRDQFDITLSPMTIKVLYELMTAFSRKSSGQLFPCSMLHHQCPDYNVLLINDIAPGSSVTLLSKAHVGSAQILMTSLYGESDSLPSSPSSTVATDITANENNDSDEVNSFEGGFSTFIGEPCNETSVTSPVLRFPQETVSELYKKITDERLRLHIPGFEDTEILCPQRSTNKIHMLQPVKNNTRYYIIVNINCNHWQRTITVSSPLQVHNETSYAMGIYYKKAILESLGYDHIGESTNPFEDTNRITIIEPDEVYNVPLPVAYHCKLHILPAYVDSYHVSETGIWWQDLASDLNTPKDIFCHPKEGKDLTVFSIKALCVEGHATSRTCSRSVPNYKIRLLPPLAVHNRLPYAIEVKIPTIKYEVRIEAGEKANVYFLNLLKTHKISIEVPSYLGIPWSGSFTLSSDLEEKIITMATEHDTEGGNKQLGLNIKVDRSEICEIIFYAPYWIINKTGLPLQIRASLSDVVYEAQGEEPLLYCFRKQRKRCIRLRAYHSSWSSAFSLDTIGTSGLIICWDRERKRKYRILLKIELARSCPHLTKVISFLPNFLVNNKSRKALRFMEDNEKADLWIDLSPDQCIPFWPDTDSMHMFVKYRDSKVISQRFPITIVEHTILRMDRGSGLCVDVSGGGERPFCIVFSPYTPGDAPVRVDNLCEDLFLKIHQQQMGQVALLSPYQSVLYTWDDPSKERLLLWNVYNKKSKDFVADFWKDGFGQERVSFHIVKQQQPSSTVPVTTPTVTAKLSASLKRLSTAPADGSSSSSDDSESDELHKTQLMKKTRKDKVVVYWVSYLEGQQRVLLFTQDERLAYQARTKVDAEKSNLELFLSLKGIGLSLTTSDKKNVCKKSQELLYATLLDSSAIWEVNVAHKWKLLTLELASWVEDRWKQDLKRAQMKDFVHVDFEKMHMTKPFFGELRRRYCPAFWLQYRRSDHHSYFHCKIHRLQVDNQLSDAVFPTVLNVTPVPQLVIRKVGIKPCVELVVMKRNKLSHNHDIYKFVKLLVQEFSIQVDRSFILSVYELLSEWHPEEKPAVRMRHDITALHQPLTPKSLGLTTDTRIMFESLHLTPLRLQFSFSPRASSTKLCIHPTGWSYTSDVLHFLLDVIAPSLTEVKNTRIRIALCEVKNRVCSLQNQKSECILHYIGQLYQQINVLLLGLDVLGNPYSLVPDFTMGLGDHFYEPPFGVVDCPEEFAQGLNHGAQIIMGHYIGGASNSMSLITSALTNQNQFQNFISFEDDFRRKRRFFICLRQSNDLPEPLLTASKTFMLGVTLGLSGIVMKPSLTGSQQDGVEGFFRSSGKGLMGLLTKPSGGVLNCVTMATDGIKRAAEIGEDMILRARLPRYLNPYLGVRPFSIYEATGMHLLNTISKGHYADTDTFWMHAALCSEGKTILIITLQRILVVEKYRLWGMWEVMWEIRVDDVMAIPDIVDDKLVFKVRQDDSYNIFSGEDKYIQCKDTTLLHWLRSQIETVLILNMEEKPCPASPDL